MNRLTCLFLISFILAGCAAAGTESGSGAVDPAEREQRRVAERPTIHAGDSWTFRSDAGVSWTYTVEQVAEDGRILIRSSSDAEEFRWIFTRDLNRVTSIGRREDSEYIPHNGNFRFPLWVGKKWKENYAFKTPRGIRDRRARHKVVAYEAVVLPVGTFWAFRIEVENEWLDGLGPTYETYWYSVAARWPIKYRSQEFGLRYELVATRSHAAGQTAAVISPSAPAAAAKQ